MSAEYRAQAQTNTAQSWHTYFARISFSTQSFDSNAFFWFSSIFSLSEQTNKYVVKKTQASWWQYLIAVYSFSLIWSIFKINFLSFWPVKSATWGIVLLTFALELCLLTWNTQKRKKHCRNIKFSSNKLYWISDYDKTEHVFLIDFHYTEFLIDWNDRTMVLF